MTKSFLKNTLSKKLLLFTGKGGVGKTAVAKATALLCKRHGMRVVFASWSPFDSGRQSQPEENSDIETIHLETLSAFREYALHILKFDKLYNVIFDNHVLKTFIKAAPGLSETVIAGKIWDLYDKGLQDILIVDLPSSGHALSFFQSPLGVQKVFSTGFIHKEAAKISQMFLSNHTRIDMVTLPEEMPITETLEFHQKLKNLFPFQFGFLHINQSLPYLELPSKEVIERLPQEIKECFLRHQARELEEKEAIETSEKLDLRTIHIPRFTSESSGKIIENTTSFLETQ